MLHDSSHVELPHVLKSPAQLNKSSHQLSNASDFHSPSQKVLLYNSGSVSKVFFTDRADAVSLSHHKRNFKDLLEAASRTKKRPFNRLLQSLIKDQERILRREDKVLGRHSQRQSLKRFQEPALVEQTGFWPLILPSSECSSPQRLDLSKRIGRNEKQKGQGDNAAFLMAEMYKLSEAVKKRNSCQDRHKRNDQSQINLTEKPYYMIDPDVFIKGSSAAYFRKRLENTAPLEESLEQQKKA